MNVPFQWPKSIMVKTGHLSSHRRDVWPAELFLMVAWTTHLPEYYKLRTVSEAALVCWTDITKP